MKNIPLKSFKPGIVWFFIVLILLCMPGRGFPKVDNWISYIYLDKWVHAGLFGVQAFLWMLPVLNSNTTKKWKRIILIGIAISLWGLATEFIQKYLIPGRDYDLLDWAADTTGVLLIMLIIRFKWLK
jgi:hypothetical protein